MKRRWKISIAVAVVLVVSVLASVIHHYQLRAATEAYIAKLKARGEPMELAQVAPPLLPPGENSADTLRKADVLFNAGQTLLSTNYFYGGMKMVLPGKAVVCADQSDLRDSVETNSWEEVRIAVIQNSEPFALLHQIIEKPNFDFDIGYGRGTADLNFSNMCLPELKAASLRLGVAAMDDLHQRNTAAATGNLRTILAIANGMREERLEISELVRVAVASLAVPETWEILQSTNVTDKELATLQNDWGNLEFLHALENAVAMERVAGAISAGKWRSANSEFGNLLLDVPGNIWSSTPKLTALDRLRIKFRIFLWRYWWSYPDELRTLKGYDFLLEAPRAAQTNDALLSVQNDLQSNIAKLSIPTNGDTLFWSSDPMAVNLHFALSDSIPSSSRIFNRIVRMEATKRVVVAAIALKRYYLKHGKYPSSLAALTPEFLSEVPRDPMDGQPLRYRLNPDGTFLLYSIGDDGKDDGGDPAPSESHKSSLWWQFGRDWVWPQPATAEEIRKFYDNLSK